MVPREDDGDPGATKSWDAWESQFSRGAVRESHTVGEVPMEEVE